ncbi:hypothetical protein LWI29_026923 [Acer saccharum]|uniref:DUF629 domain-containing protein n=1 Tax=Acer saccharum TaxID=4024 RepID=A0AA39RY70_ACESA|nr:hypothetical protein LWI29_026923 [Acer saccharum]
MLRWMTPWMVSLVVIKYLTSKSVLFSRDFTSILLDERVLRGELNVTNYVDASAIIFAADECQDDVHPERNDILSWLHMGSNCEEDVDLWTSSEILHNI